MNRLSVLGTVMRISSRPRATKACRGKAYSMTSPFFRGPTPGRAKPSIRIPTSKILTRGQIEAVGMNDAVAFMVARARAR
jgi:hypothetical protein